MTTVCSWQFGTYVGTNNHTTWSCRVLPWQREECTHHLCVALDGSFVLTRRRDWGRRLRDEEGRDAFIRGSLNKWWRIIGEVFFLYLSLKPRVPQLVVVTATGMSTVRGGGDERETTNPSLHLLWTVMVLEELGSSGGIRLIVSHSAALLKPPKASRDKSANQRATIPPTVNAAESRCRCFLFSDS